MNRSLSLTKMYTDHEGWMLVSVDVYLDNTRVESVWVEGW